jgi:hypothetical protein
VCPYEPRNFLPKSKLEAHLLRCPKVTSQYYNLSFVMFFRAKIEAKPWYKAGINFMNPAETSSIATYYNTARDEGEYNEGEHEEQKEPLPVVDVTLKDIDSKTKDILVEKVFKLYDSLKVSHSDTRFKALF